MRRPILGCITGGFTLLISMAVVNAQTVEEFYKGKQIEILNTSLVGGNAIYARTIAKYMKRYMPGNPSIVLKEMPGAGGLTLLNYLYNTAAKDGLTIATMDRGLLLEPLLGNKGANYDASKFSALGSVGKLTSTCTVEAHAQAKTLKEAMEREVLVGSLSPSAIYTIYPLLLNAVIKTKFKVILGYKVSQEILLAMERGELDGICAAWSTLKAEKADWLRDKKLIPLLQISFKVHPDLVGVPSLSDVVKDDADRKMMEFYATPDEFGRPYIAPPGTPPDRVEALRRAFDATMKDPEFLAESHKLNLEIDHFGGAEMQRLLGDIYVTPPATLKRLIDVLRPAGGQSSVDQKK